MKAKTYITKNSETFLKEKFYHHEFIYHQASGILLSLPYPILKYISSKMTSPFALLANNIQAPAVIVTQSFFKFSTKDKICILKLMLNAKHG